MVTKKSVAQEETQVAVKIVPASMQSKVEALLYSLNSAPSNVRTDWLKERLLEVLKP